MSNKIQVIQDKSGNNIFPLTHEKAVRDSAGVSLETKLASLESKTYITAWDGKSTPVVANIPAGVVVTYNGTNYTGTLAASASTDGKIYLVSSGTEYDRYFSTVDLGGNRVWSNLGTTACTLEVVDDLTTGGSTKALSAEQGKVLDDKISQLQQKAVELVYNAVDLSSLPDYDYSIKTDGTYGTSTSYKHIRVEIDGGLSGISVTANAESPARIAFLSSNASPVSGGTIPVVPGTSVIEIPIGQTSSYKIPTGTISIAIYTGQANAFRPSSVLLGGLVEDTLDSTSEGKALSARQGNVLRGLATLEYRKPDLQTAELRNARISSTLQWNNTARYRHVIVPVVPYETIVVTANSDYPATIAYLYEAGTPANNTDAPIVPGTTLTEIPVGTSATMVVPAGTAYVYVNSGDTQNGNNYARIYLPSSMEVYGTIVGPDNRSKENAAAIAGLSILRASVRTEFVGNGLTQVASLPVYNLAPGQTYRCCILNPNVSLDDTSGSNYRFQLRAYDAEGETIETMVRISTAKSLPDFVDFVVPAGTAYVRVLGRCVTDAVFPVIFFPISSSSYTGNILDLNPQGEFIPKFLSAKKRYYTSTDTNRPNPLVVLHLSDIHGNWDNVSRFLEFAGEYSDYVDELVNTGDTVSGLYTDGIDGYLALPGVSSIINVIGNHDTREGDDWQSHIGVDAYNLLVKPFVASWGVEQPAGAEANGYCYFYKDYAEKNIRMVFVDVMSYDATQNTWLASVLADARTSGYHVVIFTHFSGARNPSEIAERVFDKVSCNYTTIYPFGSASTQLAGYNPDSYMLNDAVNDFVVAGGHFVGFVQGHYHADFVATVAKYPNQLIYSIGATKAGEMRDYNHVIGTRDQDEFQIVSIDPVNTIVKLYKVGANYDRYGRKKGSVCVDYSTGQVLGEGW